MAGFAQAHCAKYRGRTASVERDRLGEAWTNPDGMVFVRESGEPLYPDSVTQLMTKFVRQHNTPCVPGRRGRPRVELPRPAVPLPRAKLHELRHLHATTLLLAGVPVHVVANRLGHADPAITLRVYAHVIHQQTDGVADRFAAAIDPDLADALVADVDAGQDDDPAGPSGPRDAAVSRSVSKPGRTPPDRTSRCKSPGR